MAVHQIVVSMIARQALLTSGNDADAHRGIWFHDPSVITIPMVVGDRVEFECCGTVIQVGVITEVDIIPDRFPKFCSGVNSKGFRWVDAA